MNKTAELLIKLRKSKGMTQNDIAQKLGVTSQAVSKWERGENLPDSMILLEISKMYNITIEEILSGSVKTKDPSEETKTNMLIFVSSFIILFSFLPLLFFFNVNRPVSIMSAVGIFSIGALILLYVGLKDEENR